MPQESSGSSADLQLEVGGGSKAIPASRRTVEGLDEYVGGEYVDKLRLLVSEVVTNAVLHGGATADLSLRLSMEVSPEQIRIEVYDPGRGFDTGTGPPPSKRDVGGWGLVLVDQLADRWGTTQEPRSTVWFELDRERPAAGESPWTSTG